MRSMCIFIFKFIKRLRIYNIKTDSRFIKARARVSARFGQSPHRKGLVLAVVIKTPKKPNSALRHVAKTSIYKNGKRIFGRIPGLGSLPTKYNRVLLRGGRANDIPTVRITLIRGVFDFASLRSKRVSRSKYGVSRPEHYTSHIRRRFRSLNS